MLNVSNRALSVKCTTLIQGKSGPFGIYGHISSAVAPHRVDGLIIIRETIMSTKATFMTAYWVARFIFWVCGGGGGREWNGVGVLPDFKMSSAVTKIHI